MCRTRLPDFLSPSHLLNRLCRMNGMADCGLKDFLNRRHCDTSAMEMFVKGEALIGTAAVFMRFFEALLGNEFQVLRFEI